VEARFSGFFPERHDGRAAKDRDSGQPMMVDLCGKTGIIESLGALLCYALLEYWLGKTSKTRAGSVVELVIVGLTLAGTLLMISLRRKKNE
jgi:hypothetical protein